MDEQRKTHFQEAAAIVELCEIAACPQQAYGFLKNGATIDQVAESLHGRLHLLGKWPPPVSKARTA